MLAWDKASPSGEMPPILELRTVANGGNDRGGGLRPNALNFRNSLAGLAFTKYPLDLLIKRRNPTIKVTKKIVELAERFSRHRRSSFFKSEMISGIARRARVMLLAMAKPRSSRRPRI